MKYYFVIKAILIFTVHLFMATSVISGPGGELVRQSTRSGAIGLWSSGVRPNIRRLSSGPQIQSRMSTSLVPYRPIERSLIVHPTANRHQVSSMASKNKFWYLGITDGVLLPESIREGLWDIGSSTIRSFGQRARYLGKELAKEGYQRGVKYALSKKPSPLKRILECGPIERVESGLEKVMSFISDTDKVLGHRDFGEAKAMTIYFENDNDPRYLSLIRDLENLKTTIYFDEQSLATLSFIDQKSGNTAIRVELIAFILANKKSTTYDAKVEVQIEHIDKIQYVTVNDEYDEDNEEFISINQVVVIEKIYPKPSL